MARVKKGLKLILKGMMGKLNLIVLFGNIFIFKGFFKNF